MTFWNTQTLVLVILRFYLNFFSNDEAYDSAESVTENKNNPTVT